MRILTLYRGMAIASTEAKEVIDRVRLNGHRGDEGAFSTSVPRVQKVRDQLDSLFAHPDLAADCFATEAVDPVICACGRRAGAEFYAAHHNLHGDNDYPIVIEFRAPIERVSVDPRDFLCTVFQLSDRNPETDSAAVTYWLEELFGSAVLRYFDSARQVKDQAHRIAMCNLASFDAEVVLAHYANRKVIGGRYGTLFESAFFVQGAIEADSIRDVYRVSDFSMRIPEVTLGLI